MSFYTLEAAQKRGGHHWKAPAAKIPVADINRVKSLVERGMSIKDTAVKMDVQMNYIKRIMNQHTNGAIRLRADYQKWLGGEMGQGL